MHVSMKTLMPLAGLALVTLSAACADTKPPQAANADSSAVVSAAPASSGQPSSASQCPQVRPVIGAACSGPVSEPDIGCPYSGPPSASGSSATTVCMCDAKRWTCYDKPAEELPGAEQPVAPPVPPRR